MEQCGNAALGAHPHCYGVRCSSERHLPVTGTRGTAMGCPQVVDDDQKEKSSKIQKSYCYEDILLCVTVNFMYL